MTPWPGELRTGRQRPGTVPALADVLLVLAVLALLLWSRADGASAGAPVPGGGPAVTEPQAESQAPAWPSLAAGGAGAWPP